MRWLVALFIACASEPTPPPERPVPKPVPGKETDASLVPPSVLEAYRIEGAIGIGPDDVDKSRMVDRGLHRVIATTKLCLSVTGEVSSVETVRSSGLPTYDRKIRKRISEWRYKPFEINGSPAPVCTIVTIIYNQ